MRDIETTIVTTDPRRILRYLKEGRTIMAYAQSHGFWFQHVVHGARRRKGQLEICTTGGYWRPATSATIFPKGHVGY